MLSYLYLYQAHGPATLQLACYCVMGLQAVCCSSHHMVFFAHLPGCCSGANASLVVCTLQYPRRLHIFFLCLGTLGTLAPDRSLLLFAALQTAAAPKPYTLNPSNVLQTAAAAPKPKPLDPGASLYCLADCSSTRALKPRQCLSLLPCRLQQQHQSPNTLKPSASLYCLADGSSTRTLTPKP